VCSHWLHQQMAKRFWAGEYNLPLCLKAVTEGSIRLLQPLLWKTSIVYKHETHEVQHESHLVTLSGDLSRLSPLCFQSKRRLPLRFRS